MGEFFHKYNTDNVHSRAVIVGMINLLNSKVYYENILSDTVVDTVYVPFYYNMGGDERFLQDYFLEWNDCIHPRHADGNYDVIPRGIVTMTAKTIDTAKMTHRFVRGTYVKEVNGELQQFNAFINSLPISITFDVEVEVDSNLDAFKIEQALMETFYKVQVYSVNFRGFRIPCQASFPEDYGVDKTFEFSYQANVRTLLKFSIAVETYYPVIDPSTERSNSNRMNTGEGSLPAFAFGESSPNFITPNFTYETPTSLDKYFSGGVLPISWTNSGSILRVNIYYRLVGATEWIPIIKNYSNSGYYNWDIPFFDSAGNEVMYDNQTAVVTTFSGRNAKVRPIINSLGEVEKIVIFEKGFGYDATDMINVSLFPMPLDIPPAYTEPEITATVVAGEVIDYQIINQGAGFIPSPELEIELKIEDTNNETVYNYISQRFEFIGDINNSLPAPDNTYITNVIPTVADMLLQGELIGLTIEGRGIPSGSVITNVNSAANRIEINNIVVDNLASNEFITSSTNGKIFIQ